MKTKVYVFIDKSTYVSKIKCYGNKKAIISNNTLIYDGKVLTYDKLIILMAKFNNSFETRDFAIERVPLIRK